MNYHLFNVILLQYMRKYVIMQMKEVILGIPLERRPSYNRGFATSERI